MTREPVGEGRSISSPYLGTVATVSTPKHTYSEALAVGELAFTVYPFSFLVGWLQCTTVLTVRLHHWQRVSWRYWGSGIGLSR